MKTENFTNESDQGSATKSNLVMSIAYIVGIIVLALAAVFLASTNPAHAFDPTLIHPSSKESSYVGGAIAFVMFALALGVMMLASRRKRKKKT